MTSLLPHSHVDVRCRGRGCPFTSDAAQPRGSAVTFTGLFGDAHPLPGATIQATVTVADAIGVFDVFRIRSGKTPTVTRLCLIPGIKNPRRCR